MRMENRHNGIGRVIAPGRAARLLAQGKLGSELIRLAHAAAAAHEEALTQVPDGAGCFGSGPSRLETSATEATGRLQTGPTSAPPTPGEARP